MQYQLFLIKIYEYIFSILKHLKIYLICVCLCVGLCVSEVLWRPEEDVRYPALELLKFMNNLMWVLKLKLGLLERQYTLWTAEPSFQPIYFSHYKIKMNNKDRYTNNFNYMWECNNGNMSWIKNKQVVNSTIIYNVGMCT